MNFSAAEKPTIYAPASESLVKEGAVKKAGPSSLPTFAIPSAPPPADEIPAISGIRPLSKEMFEEQPLSESAFLTARTEVESFIFSNAFRALSHEGIPESVIAALEQFHQQAKRTSGEEMVYKQEMRSLEQAILNAVEQNTDAFKPDEMTNALVEFLDLVKDPFMCHAVWVVLSAGKTFKKQ